MTAHAPGVACIVHGIRDSWSARDNGRIVVIVKFKRESRLHGRFWVIRPRDGEPDLHSYRETQPSRSRNVSTLQKYLIPLGPEAFMEFYREPKESPTDVPETTERDHGVVNWRS